MWRYSPTIQLWPSAESFEDQPIQPEWIRSGHPLATAILVDEHADGSTSGFWRCTPGSFEWQYHADELIRIGSGRATLQEGRVVVDVSAGDFVSFRAGTTVLWVIHETVTKHWFLAASEPAPIWKRMAQRLDRSLRRASRATPSPAATPAIVLEHDPRVIAVEPHAPGTFDQVPIAKAEPTPSTLTREDALL